MTLPPTAKENAYKYCFNLLNIGDMTLPHYWSNLFLAMRSILSEEQLVELQQKILEVELMAGYKMHKIPNPEKEGETMEVFKPVMTLYEIETYLFNSYNLKSYFNVKGKKITQFEIERKLFEVKSWCFQLMFAMQHRILFTRPLVRL